MVSSAMPSVAGYRAEAAHAGLFLVGRILLVALFVLSGSAKLTNIDGFATLLGTRFGLPAAYPLAAAGAAVEFITALAVIVGFKTRWAAAALVVFTLAATYLAHRYWTFPPDQVMNQYNHFLKNIALIGGLLMLIAAGPGRWSLDRT
jgi:putative oxidoreductase